MLEEIHFYTRMLDELLQGRAIEVADSIASRLKYLTLGVKTDNWTLAAEFQAYRPREHSLISNESLQVAAKLAKKTAQLKADIKALAAKP